MCVATDVYKRQVNQLTERFPLLNEFKAVQEGQVWCTTQSLFQQSLELADLIVDMNRVFTKGTPAALSLIHIDVYKRQGLYLYAPVRQVEVN